MSHSLFSPSGANRYMNCIGSVVVSQGLPEKSNKHADEGTVAHDLGAKQLQGEDTSGIKSIDGVDITDAMRERVDKYVSTVESMSEGAIMTYIEETLDLSEVLDKPGEKGTSDFIALLIKELQVHEYKDGYILVDAKENEQLMLYAAGVIKRFGLAMELDTKVRLVVHQPRRNRISEWVTSVAHILHFAELEVKPQIAKIDRLIADPTLLCDEDFNPSEKTCRWCKYKLEGKCEHLAKFVEKAIKFEFDNLDENAIKMKGAIPEISNERVSHIIKNTSLIKSFLDCVSAHALELLLKGEDIPGYKAIEGKADSKAWMDAKEAEKLLKSMKLKIDEMFKKSLITPTQALALFKKKPRSLKKVNEVISVPGLAYKMVEESHKGDKVVLKDDFEDLDNDDISDLY